ncbi:MAG: anti-sigma factor antagonist [Planctomycetota bacterium]
MKVHLSHGARDRRVATLVAESLTKSGLEVSTATREDTSELEANPRAADAYVFLVSADGFGPWMQFELGVALAARARVVTLLLPGVREAELPKQVRDHLMVDARESLERAVELVQANLRGTQPTGATGGSTPPPKADSRFVVDWREDLCVIHIRGEFDTFYCPQLQELADQALNQDVCHIVLEMRMTKFINSTALGAILKVHKMCRARGGDLVIAQPSNFTKDVVYKVGIDKIVQVFESLAEAEAFLAHGRPSQPQGDEGGMVFAVGPQARELRERADILNVDQNGVRFAVARDATAIDVGAQITAKLTIPLIKKQAFDVEAVVAKVQPSDNGGRVVEARWARIDDGDRMALAQFADDMEFLRRQLPS